MQVLAFRSSIFELIFRFSFTRYTDVFHFLQGQQWGACIQLGTPAVTYPWTWAAVLTLHRFIRKWTMCWLHFGVNLLPNQASLDVRNTCDKLRSSWRAASDRRCVFTLWLRCHSVIHPAASSMRQIPQVKFSGVHAVLKAWRLKALFVIVSNQQRNILPARDLSARLEPVNIYRRTLRVIYPNFVASSRRMLSTSFAGYLDILDDLCASLWLSVMRLACMNSNGKCF